MLCNQPRPNHRPKAVDCAEYDPATWRFRTGVPMGAPAGKVPASQAFLDSAPPQGAETEMFGWFRAAEKRVQVEPRVEGYAFDPLFMTEPNIFQFERDNQPLPRRFYRQTRKNKKVPGQVRYDELGAIARTANDNDPIQIYVIEWEKHSGGVLDFVMKDKNYNEIVVGYCKQTDYGGAFKWVVVVTELHGANIPADQGPRMFSYPLYGALSSGVSFGIWYENVQIQTKFPSMGAGVPRDDEAELVAQMDRNARLRSRRQAGIPVARTKMLSDSLTDGIAGMAVDPTGIAPPRDGAPRESVASVEPKVAAPAKTAAVAQDVRGAVLASVLRMGDRNIEAKHESECVRFDPPNKAKGAGMLVRPAGRELALGAIYPMAEPELDIRHDGLCISRMEVIETPVKFANEALRGVSRYEIKLFATGVEEPVGTLEALPQAFPDKGDATKLALSHHALKVVEASTWNVPGIATRTVSNQDVATVATKAPAWDKRLTATIEATMSKLRSQDASAIVQMPPLP